MVKVHAQQDRDALVIGTPATILAIPDRDRRHSVVDGVQVVRTVQRYGGPRLPANYSGPG